MCSSGSEYGCLIWAVVILLKRDLRSERGYLQKSVVLISLRPYLALFKRVIRLVGPLFFEYGTPLLEATFQSILAWFIALQLSRLTQFRPEPQNDKTLDLPILGTVLSFYTHSSLIHIVDPIKTKTSPLGTQKEVRWYCVL